MTGPTLCVTSPARTIGGAKASAEAALRDGADLLELRFDRWADVERRRAKELFPSPIPLIATYRSMAEGGEGSTDPQVRGEVLRELRRLPFAAVDRERARDPAPPSSGGPPSIASRHLAAPVDWAGFSTMLSAGLEKGERGKIVAPATVGEFLGPFRELRTAPGAPAAIVQSVGPSGPLSRALPDWLRTDWVFAAPGPSDALAENPLERSQVPVDRLRSVLGRSPPGPLFAVVGHPIDFSESPGLHHGWLRRAGRDGAYLALDVETEREFRDLLELLGVNGFRGLNVTHPWKRLARAAVVRVESSAEEADAANCLTWDGAEWIAALTDVEAVERRLTELRREGGWDGGELTVLGGGAAARATVLAARRLGARARVRTRSPEALEELRRRFPETVLGAARDPTRLLVHATTFGRPGSPTLGFPVDDLLQAGGFCLDFVYGEPPSPLRGWCDAAEVGYEDGRRLLRYQAEESYRRWWGERPPEGPSG